MLAMLPFPQVGPGLLVPWVALEKTRTKALRFGAGDDDARGCHLPLGTSL